MATRHEQLILAEALGNRAFNSGMKRICAMDKDLNKMLLGRNIGETPKGEAKSTSIMIRWYNGFDKANLNK
jgi:hypothetical protein